MSNSFQVFDSVFTVDEINQLRMDQHQRPIAGSVNNIQDKCLDYQLPMSVAHRIIKPKLDSLIGPDHEFSTGCYKDAWAPYRTHIDNTEFQTNNYKFGVTKRYNLSVLIPLVEDPEFRTVLFDVHSNENLGMGQPLPEKYLTSNNNLDLAWFSHMNGVALEQIPRIPLDSVWQWKLGSFIVWSRTQLHSSTDFSKFGLCKKFVIIFLA